MSSTAMAEAVSKPSIMPLDTSNYATWEVRMKALLKSKKVWKIVENGLSEGAVTRSGDEEHEKELEQDDEALALILLNVEDHNLTRLKRCKTAKEAWEALAGVYQSKSTAQWIKLQYELKSLTLQADEPVFKYVARATGIQDQLAVTGEPVTDTQVALYALAGLPSEYDNVADMFEFSKEKLTLDELLPKLQNVEQRRTRGLEKTSETALYSSNRPQQGRPRDKRLCFYCDKPGHVVRDCHKKKKDLAQAADAPRLREPDTGFFSGYEARAL